MNFTFGIITDHTFELSPYLPKIIQSIKDLKISNYEILVVGDLNQLNKKEYFNDIKVIHFNQKKGWVTRQKNLITHHSQYDNIVYLHDYICFEKDWYEGYKKFGDNFDVCMNKIKNLDGSFFRSWSLFPWHLVGYPNHPSAKLWKYAGIENNECMLPDNENRLKQFQYISGSYWVAKKSIMLKYPLNESLFWEQGEDLEWSARVIPNCNYVMNPYSIVYFAKQKTDALHPIKPDVLEKCINYISKFK